LATSPGAGRGDGERAVTVAREAVGIAPGNGEMWNTLGVALVRAEARKEALEVFEKSTELRNGGDAYDWFFVAIAQWHLDRREQARESYDKALAWMEANAKGDEELKRFRDEAAALLGVP
jgi:tetratricopeptide (TPR) repeat protein